MRFKCSIIVCVKIILPYFGYKNKKVYEVFPILIKEQMKGNNKLYKKIIQSQIKKNFLKISFTRNNKNDN